jgi:flagellar protein FlbT
MSLRVELGPFEKLFIGKSVLTNHGARSMFVIDGDIPILRAKDVLSPNLTASPLERLYYCVQQMYLEEDPEKYQKSYLALARQTISENSNLGSELQVALQLITSGQHYRALNGLKKLLKPEAFAVSKTNATAPRPQLWRG